MTGIDLAKMVEDLSSRLYYCSNTGEGRKARKELEKRIKQLEKQLLKTE